MPLRPDMGLRDFAKVFRRRKWLIVFSVLFILLGGAVYCVVTPELYKSTTSILIIPQSVPQDFVRSTITVRVDQQLSTIKQQVLSRTTLTKVMEELGLFAKERQRLSAEDVVELMRKRIDIDVFQGRGRESSDAFTLSFLYENPRSAMQAASRLASYFIDENLKTREQQAVGTSEFLDSQLKETKARLEQLEARVKDYKMRYTGELPQQQDANLRLLTGLQDRLRSNDTAIRTLDDRRVFLEAQLNLMEKSLAAPATENGPLTPVSPMDPAQTLMVELAQKRAKLADLNARFTPKHPSVVSTKQEVAQLETRIAEIRGTMSKQTEETNGNSRLATPVLTPAAEEIRKMKVQLDAAAVEIASLKKERKEIQQAIASVERKIEVAPRREQEMISLIRDYDNQKKSYDDLLKKKLEADVAQNLEKRQKGTQFQILDPANLPETPFKPDRTKAMGIALALALAVGFGGAVFLESIDLALRDVRDFKHLFKVPILGYIPVVHDRRYRRGRVLRQVAVVGGLVTFTVALSVFLLLYNDKIRTILNF
jgi:polysaccharide chain length determinant protein (PEP-CTERM system associated)